MTILADLNVEILPIDPLRPYRLNAHRHSERQVAQIADSIREFGWNIPIMGSLYRSAHELVLIFKSGSALHVNNVQLGGFGRNRLNVWPYASINSFGSGRKAALAMHPTVEPAAMVADAILDCSDRGDIELDPFAGSATIVIAAHRTRRRARAIELDPNFADVCLRRFCRVTGIDPIRVASGLALSELEARAARSADNEAVRS